MKLFTVDILTPSRVVAKNVAASALLIPTVKGQMNVLENHTHIVTELETGEITLFGSEDGPDRYFSVTVGVCKIQEDKIVILADTSEESTEINVERAEAALENARQVLSKTDNMADWEIKKWRGKLERAKLRTQLASYSKKKQ